MELTVDTSPFSQIDKRFFVVLFASVAVHAIAATWVARQPHVSFVEESVAERPFNRAPLLPIPKTFPAPVKVAPAAPKISAPRGTPTAPKGPAGLLGMQLTDVADGANAEAALFGAQRSNVDTSLLASRRIRGPNEAQAIGPITTTAVAPVAVGEHQDVALKTRVDPIVPDGPDLPNPDMFIRYINARRPALAACYERELKYNRALRGRVVVHLMIAEDGRAREVEVDDETLRSPAVSECIETIVGRWIFPVKPDDALPLQFPVLFTPAQ